MALSANFLASGTATAGTGISFNFNCGAADASKLAVIGLHQTGGLGGKLITAITVDGVNCLANVTQGQRHAQVWCALPSSSGVVTVSLTYDNAPGAFSWGAWSVLGSSGSPTDTQSTFNNSDASRSLAMTIPTGGIGLVSGTKAGTAGTNIVTTNATEDYEAANASSHRYIGAHTTTTGAVSPGFNAISSMVGFAFEAGGNSGELSKTESGDTTSSAATLPITGALSRTEAANTVSSAAALAIAGTLTKTEVPDTEASTGTLAIQGVASLTEVGDTVLSDATGATTGTATLTEAPDTSSATGVLPITGTLSKAEGADTSAATGTLAIVGSLSKTEGADTLSSAGTLVKSGSLTVTEASDTLLSAGTLPIFGAANVSEAGDTLAAIVTVPAPISAILEVEDGGTLAVITARPELRIEATTRTILKVAQDEQHALVSPRLRFTLEITTPELRALRVPSSQFGPFKVARITQESLAA